MTEKHWLIEISYYGTIWVRLSTFEWHFICNCKVTIFKVIASSPKMVGHWCPPRRRPVPLAGRRIPILDNIIVDNIITITDTMLSIEEKVAPSSNLSNDTKFLYVPFLVLKLSCKEKKWSATGMFTLYPMVFTWRHCNEKNTPRQIVPSYANIDIFCVQWSQTTKRNERYSMIHMMLQSGSKEWRAQRHSSSPWHSNYQIDKFIQTDEAHGDVSGLVQSTDGSPLQPRPFPCDMEWISAKIHGCVRRVCTREACGGECSDEVMGTVRMGTSFSPCSLHGEMWCMIDCSTVLSRQSGVIACNWLMLSVVRLGNIDIKRGSYNYHWF